MSKLSRASFEVKFNDAAAGLYKAGQVDAIGSDDHRALVADILDSVLWPEDLRQIAAMTAATLPAYTFDGVDTLTADVDGSLIIDDVYPLYGDTVIVSLESDPELNGIYLVSDQGSGFAPFILTKFADSLFEEAMYVVAGTANAGTILYQRGGATETPYREQDTFAVLPPIAVLDAFDTPVDLITAPGAGKGNVLTDIVVYMDFVTTEYQTNIQFAIQYADGTQIIVDTDFLSKTSDSIRTYTIPISDAVINSAIQFTVLDGNPTDGDSNIKFILKYRTIQP
ncbi:MAG TPA: hypothetical protein VK508_01735 [Cyclobacteriaceae bacterium]|nr:hypothetical protein [Cyclobacteriaceae bacterium]